MNIETIQQELFRQRPHLARVIEVWGDKSVLAYHSQEFPDLSEPSVDILDAIFTETAPLLGTMVADQARRAVAHQKWTNTADHHGLLFHPYFFGAALARSHRDVRIASDCTVTLPFGGISLSNDSFPRGFVFHDSTGAEQRIIFKSLHERRLPVYALTPIDKSVVLRERNRVRSFNLHVESKAWLHELLTQFENNERLWNQKTYSAQLTIMNTVLWHFLFKTNRGEFVYLELDSVVRRLMLEKHLVSETLVQKIVFDSEWREKFVSLFSGIRGSHSATSGTHLFWYIDNARNQRRGLRVVGDSLRTETGDVSIPLTPESIVRAFEKRILMPSSALLLIVCDVERLACGGGITQPEYQSQMIVAWNELQKQMGVSNILVPLPAILSGEKGLFQISTGSDRALATLIDLGLHNDNITSLVDHAVETVTVRDAVSAMLLTSFYGKEYNPERLQLSHALVPLVLK